MNIEQWEITLKFYNKKLTNLNSWYKRIPTLLFKNMILRRMIKVKELRDEAFRQLREETRKKYPERFIGSDY